MYLQASSVSADRGASFSRAIEAILDNKIAIFVQG